MSRWLQKQWYRIGLWHLLLIPLSWLFGLLAAIRRGLYRIRLLPSSSLSVPIVVVGNISVGGTGKTPLVIWLVEHLKQHGYRPGIISRGYGGNAGDVLPVHEGSDPAITGDEPVLLAKRSQCPVWVGRDRVRTAQALLETHPQCDIIVSDDGLQHYRLSRDFEIAVIDGNRGFGNGYLLPAGPLRESPQRLTTVDAVVVNGDGVYVDAYTMQLKTGAFHNLQSPEKMASATDFSGRSICAVAGIGNPARFFQYLHDLGLQFEERIFADHHAFQAADLQSIAADVILMTEKDAVKCTAFAQPDWWYLPVTAAVDQGLIARILQRLRK
jgi:tetraacyldisaccharide 4'-kinase